MLNVFTKTMPWMVASLIAATSVFGKTAPQNGSQCPPKPSCPQPCPPTQVCPGDPCCPSWPSPVLNAAYNYPSRIQTRCPWDVYADASFIYWQPLQENMELGYLNNTATTNVDSSNGKYINMDFDFKPGFKVGFGGNFDYDNWDLHLEYTWFHSSHSNSARRQPDTQILSAWEVPPVAAKAYSNTTTEDWTLKMDILQLDLGRWNYVGTQLTFHPYYGARAAWIRQKTKVKNVNDGTLGPNSGSADEAYIRAKTLSWAVGPEVGLDAKWNLGAGFRFYGDVEGDLLFTRYTRASFSQTRATSLDPVSFKQNDINCLRGHVDMELGFGWGTYIDCNNWYLDFSAGYGFQAFFDQNMFRKQINGNASIMPYGNLYVHGATGTFRLDF